MARPHDKTPLIDHPAIGKNIRIMRRYGSMTPCACKTCPECGSKQWLPLHSLRQYLKRLDRFTGFCRKCKAAAIRDGHAMWLTKKNYGRNIVSNGYVQLARCVIDEADMPMFLAMCPPSRPHVLEHRWVMAKHLGRPLTTHECVDHRDGNKTNNAIDNLRIYRRGKNEEGSANGHGTYYHEWQMAERRIRLLKQQLKTP